jgi:hypothetical protein
MGKMYFRRLNSPPIDGDVWWLSNESTCKKLNASMDIYGEYDAARFDPSH